LKDIPCYPHPDSGASGKIGAAESPDSSLLDAAGELRVSSGLGAAQKKRAFTRNALFCSGKVTPFIAYLSVKLPYGFVCKSTTEV
jgi:hypothetical protein